MFIFKQIAGNRETILWIFTSEFKDSIFLGGRGREALTFWMSGSFLRAVYLSLFKDYRR